MKIDIVSDTVCPWCYIGKRRLEKALACADRPAPEIAWHPFQLNPDMPPGGMPRGQYLALKFGGAQRAERAYATVTQVAAAECPEVDLAAIERTPNTLDSHRLIRYAAEAAAPKPRARRSRRFSAPISRRGRISATPLVLARVAGACGLEEDAAPRLDRQRRRRRHRA